MSLRVRWFAVLVLVTVTAPAVFGQPAPAPAPTAKPAPGVPPATRVITSVWGRILGLPPGWTRRVEAGPPMLDRIEHSTAGVNDAAVLLEEVVNCVDFDAGAAAQAGAQKVSAPAYLPPGWPDKAVETTSGGERIMFICYPSSVIPVAMRAVFRTGDQVAMAALRELLVELAVAADNPSPKQVIVGTRTMLSVTGLFVDLPDSPIWYRRVRNRDDGQTSDWLRRLGKSLAIEVELLVASGGCDANLKRYPGKPAKKPAYLPADWTKKARESVDAKTKVVTMAACVTSATGTSGVVVVITAAGKLAAADSADVVALLTKVSEAKRAREMRDNLPPIVTTPVEVRGRQLVVDAPAGDVEWHAAGTPSGGIVFTRLLPYRPKVSVTIGGPCSMSAMLLTPSFKGAKVVKTPSYAPTNLGQALELTKDGTVTASMCKKQQLNVVFAKGELGRADEQDVAQLLTAIVEARTLR